MLHQYEQLQEIRIGAENGKYGLKSYGTIVREAGSTWDLDIGDIVPGFTETKFSTWVLQPQYDSIQKVEGVSCCYRPCLYGKYGLYYADISRSPTDHVESEWIMPTQYDRLVRPPSSCLTFARRGRMYEAYDHRERPAKMVGASRSWDRLVRKLARGFLESWPSGEGTAVPRSF